jgi:hypothetical protein
MPPDGLGGRPTLPQLKDGQTHYLAAVYDSATEFKGIYVDGTLRFGKTYSPATLISSGGSAVAQIGNVGSFEPYTRILDEVAFYDSALTADQIAAHYANVQAGHDYFFTRTRHLAAGGIRTGGHGPSIPPAPGLRTRRGAAPQNAVIGSRGDR